jgi:hypothetical protein
VRKAEKQRDKGTTPKPRVRETVANGGREGSKGPKT